MAVTEEAVVGERPLEEEDDFLQINSVDHVEFWVGNAKQSVFFWKLWGFNPVAYSGLETGNRRFASYVLAQDDIRLILSTPYSPTDEMAAHQLLHGDGVRVIAFGVDDVESAYRETTRRGAVGVTEPHETQDGFGVLRSAAIETFGQTLIRFVDRSGYAGAFQPGYQVTAESAPAPSIGLKLVDHYVGAVEFGKMDKWIQWFHRVMGMRQIQHFDDQVLHSDYSALMSKVMAGGNGRIKMPIVEPAPGRAKSWVEEFLNYYVGPGVHHLALLTDDIVSTVRRLRDNGIQFLRVPDTYYDLVRERIGTIDESYDDIAELGILADRDDEGYLLQIFTMPIQDRPTFFMEIIQRRGAQGFGVNNFRALFESLELEQARRGNLK